MMLPIDPITLALLVEEVIPEVEARRAGSTPVEAQDMDGAKEQWLPGETAWFEYHCWESPQSQDAQLWYRSHQPVTVVEEQENDSPRSEFPTFQERCDEGMPHTYSVQFIDGTIGCVFEDELLTDPMHYTRDDPPASS